MYVAKPSSDAIIQTKITHLYVIIILSLYYLDFVAVGNQN
jgi:hypothetical protein